jgi:hypothetical protein
MVQLCCSGGELLSGIPYKSIIGMGISVNQTDNSSNTKKSMIIFFVICVTLLFDQMQHLRIEQIYMPNIHKNKESICILLKNVDSPIP